MNKREEIICNNLGLVYKAAGKRYWPLDFNERFSIGCESLIKAVDTYDPSRGSSLSSHFYRQYHSDLLNAINRDTNPRNVVSFDAPIPSKDGGDRLTLHDIIPSEYTPTIDKIILQEQITKMRAVVANLPQKWQRLINLRYITNGGANQRDVAMMLKTSKSTVLREERRALNKCRALMEC